MFKSLFSDKGKHTRSAVMGESVSVSDPLGIAKLFGFDNTTVLTRDNQLSVSTVYSCVDLLSSSISICPFEIYYKANGRTREDDSHYLYPLLSLRPSLNISASVLKKWLMVHVFVYGNGIIKVNRQQGRILGYELLRPSQYTMYETSDNRLFIHRMNGEVLVDSDIIHIRAMSLNENIGLSPCLVVNRPVKLAMSSEEYAYRYFENGAFMSGYLQVESTPDRTKLKDMSDEWDSKYRGSSNFGRTPVLGAGAKYIPLNRTNTDNQTIEFLKLSPQKICEIFRVPPHLIGDTSKSTSFGSGIGDLKNQFTTYTILPWAKQIEEEFTYKSFTEKELRNYSIRLDLDELNRGDMQARFEAYSKAVQNGIFSPNEIREEECYDGYKGGDLYMANGSLMPIDIIAKKTLETKTVVAAP